MQATGSKGTANEKGDRAAKGPLQESDYQNQAGAVELERQTPSMALLDSCTITNRSFDKTRKLAVLLDPDSNDFSFLTLSARDFIEFAEQENRPLSIDEMVDLAEFMDSRISRLFSLCEDVDDLGNVRAHLSSMTTKAAKKRAEELGEDPDELMMMLSKFFLISPEL